MPRKLAYLGGALIAVAAVTVALAWLGPRPQNFTWTQVDPALPAPALALTDDDGEPFDLNRLRGRVGLVYFGYTHCPDECPLTMAKLRTAFDLLDEDGSRIQVLLVTTDPGRDTADRLNEYLASFEPSFLGLTGTPAELQRVYDAYGVTVLEGGEAHSNRLYVIDPEGNLVATVRYEQTASEIASDLNLILAGD